MVNIKKSSLAKGIRKYLHPLRGCGFCSGGGGRKRSVLEARKSLFVRDFLVNRIENMIVKCLALVWV